MPKGPQLKIQRACREAGLASHDDKPARPSSALSRSESTGFGTLSNDGEGGGAKALKVAGAAGAPVEDDSSDCHICFERPIEVRDLDLSYMGVRGVWSFYDGTEQAFDTSTVVSTNQGCICDNCDGGG